MALELDLRQSPALSQRMIQSVRILQMTAQELEGYLDELALENPTLDVEKPASESIDAYCDRYAAREEYRYRTLKQHNDDDYDPRDNWNLALPDGETLADHLRDQLDTRQFNRRELALLNAFLESLDERGYITADIETLSQRYGVSTETVEGLLRHLQALEPVGTCARTLAECLSLQLEAAGLLDDALSQLLNEGLELVARNKTVAIANRLGITPAEAAHYCEIIRALDPHPGARFFRPDETRYVTPDVYILRRAEGWQILLNDRDIPAVTVNSYYQKLYRRTEDAETKAFLEKKLGQAEWVRQCITQRQSTLRRVAEEILRRQETFFAEGSERLQSMKLVEIADALEIHESTVSRAVNGKYLLCDHGLFPMQALFQRKATARDSRSEATDAQDHTSTEIKRMLREIIRTENPRKPFSDRILGEKLAEQGATISRRTVAKYRDELGIPDASGRKQR